MKFQLSLLFFVWSLLCIKTFAAENPPCQLSFHGIKLGMTVQQVKSTLPFLKISKEDKYGVQESFLFVVADKRQRKRLPKVFEIELWFLHSRLVRFNVAYYGSKSSPMIEQFVRQVVQANKLTDKVEGESRIYKCENTRINIATENRKEISLRDITAEALLNKRVEDSYLK